MAKVPATSEWRRAENVYYPPDLREAPAVLLGFKTEATPATTTPEQFPSTQASLTPILTGDQGQRVERAKGKKAGQGSARPEDKGKGKKAETLP